MIPLFLIVHIFVGTTIAGSAMILALTMGFDTLRPLITAAAMGGVLSIPVSWAVASRIAGLRKN
ncbi:MAG: CTP synthetase [Rhodobacteraceae bacterium]|nr:MAG: CTP synthetase [Paracoccaceae bacterium]